MIVRPDLRDKRLSNVHAMMEAYRLNGIYINGLPVNYLQGMPGMSMFVSAKGPAVVMCGDHERETPLVDYRAGIEDKWIQESALNTQEELSRLASSCGADHGRLGVFLPSMTLAQHEMLRGLLPDAELVDITGPYLALMNVNDELNVEYAKRSAQIVTDCFQDFCGRCRPGESVTALNQQMDSFMILQGASATFNMIRPVYRAPEAVGQPRDVIAEGDAYFCEVTAAYHDVWTQRIFPVTVGREIPEVRRLAQANAEAYHRVCELIHGGINSEILHAPVHEVFQKHGLMAPGTFACVPIGHYMGMQMDGGTFSPGNALVIESGMIVVVHTTSMDETTQIKLFGPGGAMLVTDSGVEPFYSLKDSLYVVG